MANFAVRFHTPVLGNDIDVCQKRLVGALPLLFDVGCSQCLAGNGCYDDALIPNHFTIMSRGMTSTGKGADEEQREHDVMPATCTGSEP